MRLIGYAGERPVFIGGTKEMCECRAYYCLPMAMQVKTCCPPPKSDSNFLALVMHSLWISIMDRKAQMPWVRVSGLCVNDSQILSTAGVDMTTTMASFLL